MLFFLKKYENINYIVDDNFKINITSGNVNNSLAFPVGGVRTVEDTGNRLSIVDGSIVISSDAGSYNEPNIRYTPQTRKAGLMIIGAITPIAYNNSHNGISFGADNDATGGFFNNLIALADSDTAGGLKCKLGGGITKVANSIALGSKVLLAVIFRSVGAFYFIKGENYKDWILIAIDTTTTSANIYAGMCSGYGRASLDFIKIPIELWLPSPETSMSFSGNNGIKLNTLLSDGLGHSEGSLSGGIGTGGKGRTFLCSNSWTLNGSGGLINTPTINTLTEFIATSLHSSPFVIQSISIIRPDTSKKVGLVLNVDNNTNPTNGIVAYLDNTNIKLDKIINGNITNIFSTPFTYSSGAKLIIKSEPVYTGNIITGIKYYVFYNNLYINTTTLTGADYTALGLNVLHGIYSNNSSNILDDLNTYLIGVENQYKYLSKFEK